jgi:hypothetical protein
MNFPPFVVGGGSSGTGDRHGKINPTRDKLSLWRKKMSIYFLYDSKRISKTFRF